MGNDNIMKEIEKIKQEINKEVRGKWIGDKYVYPPLQKETLYQKFKSIKWWRRGGTLVLKVITLFVPCKPLQTLTKLLFFSSRK